MPTHLIRRLQQFIELSPEEKRALEHVASLKTRRLGPREDLIREGDKPRHVHLVLEGWGYRYQQLVDGRRQITAFLLPGDLCDARMSILDRMDHSIGTVTPVTVAEIQPETLIGLLDRYPSISGAMSWSSLVDEALAREWLTSLGQRDAAERVAHLLCELFIRLRGVGLTSGQTCELPMTQADLADALGLSTVHVNRTLQELRAAGLLALKGKMLTIPDLEALQATALFSPDYLHLGRNGQDIKL